MTQFINPHHAQELSFDNTKIRVSYWRDDHGTRINSIMRTDSGNGGIQWDMSAEDLRKVAAMLISQANALDAAHQADTVNH